MPGKRPVVFLGTPAAAVTVLDAIVSAGHPVPMVVSRADARRGRGSSVSPSPVKARALELGLSVTDNLDDLRAMDVTPDTIAVVVAYGRIIPADLLSLMPMVNVHFSLLPRWRGAAPVERAILAGDAETGVCIMQMEEGLDTGAVYARESTPITGTETSEELTQRLAVMGAILMCRVLGDELPVPVPQTGESTYAKKITTADAEINWQETPDVTVRRVRAVNAHTFVDGRRVRVIDAESSTDVVPASHMDANGLVGTPRGSVRLLRVQPEGKQAMAAGDWIRGLKTVFPVRIG
ncbi:MAG: hypothetical protein RJA47_299 [Actinomycetota bacterium]